MANYTVLKFGGTSLADADAVVAAAQAVTRKRRHSGVVSVVSAPRGITNALLACVAGTVASHDRALASIRDQFLTTAARIVDSALELDDLERRADRLFADARRALETANTHGASPRVRDAVAATGERLSAPLFAAALRHFGVRAEAVEAGDVVVTDAEHGDAYPNLAASSERIRAILDPIVDRGCVPVVPGFVGAAPCGRTTTLGRGGSDLTAALIAVAGKTDVTYLKDVDGVLTADPGVVPGARTVPSISFAELCELACFGGKVIQYRAARLLASHRVPVTIRGIYDSDLPGTTVAATGAGDGAVRAVTLAGGFGAVRATGYGVSRAPVPRVASLFKTGVPALRLAHASSEAESSYVVIPAEYVSETADQLGRIGTVATRTGLAVVSVVGDGLHDGAGTLARVFERIGASGARVRAAEVGGSGAAIRFVVEEQDAEHAVRCAHELTEPASELVSCSI